MPLYRRLPQSRKNYLRKQFNLRMGAKAGGYRKRAVSDIYRPGASGGWKVPRRFVSTKRAAMNLRTGGFSGIELKFLDCKVVGTAVVAATDAAGGEIQPSSGCTNALSVPAIGDSQSERIGRKYTIKSMQVTGSIDVTANSATASIVAAPTVFVALVLDTQTNGQAITSEQVFQNVSGSALTNGQMLRNLAYSSRYRVLATRKLVLQPAMIGSLFDAATFRSMAQPKTFRMFWSGNIEVTCSGTTADVASATDNAISLIAFSTDSALQPKISFESRMRYVG